jgi:S-DNA-T family DNA segregation ATPase FtsK/SpoIIIE
MIISTQRPSTDIVTGRIKANFPTRIAFRTVSGTDSRVILDRIGAEKLTGKGDMLYYNGGETIRCQCAYIPTEDVLAMCSEIEEEYSECTQTYLLGGELEKVYNPRTNPWGLSKEKLEWYANRGVTFGY